MHTCLCFSNKRWGISLCGLIGFHLSVDATKVIVSVSGHARCKTHHWCVSLEPESCMSTRQVASHKACRLQNVKLLLSSFLPQAYNLSPQPGCLNLQQTPSKTSLTNQASMFTICATVSKNAFRLLSAVYSNSSDRPDSDLYR